MYILSRPIGKGRIHLAPRAVIASTIWMLFHAGTKNLYHERKLNDRQLHSQASTIVNTKYRDLKEVRVPILLLNQPTLQVTKLWFQAGTNHLYHTLKQDWKYTHSKFDATAKEVAKMSFCSIPCSFSVLIRMWCCGILPIADAWFWRIPQNL